MTRTQKRATFVSLVMSTVSALAISAQPAVAGKVGHREANVSCGSQAVQPLFFETFGDQSTQTTHFCKNR